MTVGTYEAPVFTSDDAATYKGKIDAGMGVMANVAAAFAPHEAATPNMTVVIDAGRIQSDTTITSVSQQTTSTITAPVTNPRIDRIVIDKSDGSVSIIPGTENVSPVAPELTVGKIAVAQVLLATSTTAITNSLITDERPIVQSIKKVTILDSPVQLLQTFSTATWTALDMSAIYAQAATDGAVSAILKVSVSTSAATGTGACACYLRKTGESDSADATTMAARCYANATGDEASDVNTTIVNLDGNSDFDYEFQDATGAGRALRIHLVGYYHY